MTTAAAFWKNGSFAEHLLQETSGACVHAKPRSIKAICIVSGERGQSHISLNPQREQQNLGSGQQTRLYTVYMLTNTIKYRAKPKSSLKLCPEDTQYREFTRGKYTYICKNLGWKEGGGHLVKRGEFLRSYGTIQEGLFDAYIMHVGLFLKC